MIATASSVAAKNGRSDGDHEPSKRAVLLCLIGIAAVSTVVRAVLATRVHAPTVFSDEIGYTKLAQSIGRSGRFALFNDPGLSYSPLYPAVLSPIYALGASGPTAYSLIKIANAFLISLSIFPAYKIARFALSRWFSLLVAGLVALAPVMSYPAFTMSENLAYPACLFAVWAMLETVERPSARADAVLLASIFVATAARIQLVVLIPAALTAVVGAGILARDGELPDRALVRAAREHWLLFGVVCAGLVIAGAAALAGREVLSVFGRYADVGRRGFPNVWHFLNLLVRHLAGIDLAVGVIPFIAALVAAYAFVRSRSRSGRRAFAAVAVSVTGWLLLEVAFDAALFDVPHGDVPRIHERFLIYVVPLFLVALVAAYRARAPARVYLGAAAIAALLPAVIPFGTVVNGTITFESLGLHPFATVVHGELGAVPHATVVAVLVGAILGVLYVLVRERLRTVVILLLLPFIVIWGLARTRIEATSVYARSLLPAHTDWVDRAHHPAGDVILLTGGPKRIAELETAYHNLSIDRLYYLCRFAFGPEFGEREATVDPAGRLHDGGADVTAAYVVAPAALGIRGRVVARNRKGREVLVAPEGGRVAMPPGRRATVNCARPAR